MGARMSHKFRKLIEERKLTKIKSDEKLVRKEIEGAESDLRTATKSPKDKDFKWATIQGYYSIFHAARALLYTKGSGKKATMPC